MGLLSASEQISEGDGDTLSAGFIERFEGKETTNCISVDPCKGMEHRRSEGLCRTSHVGSTRFH